MDPTEKELTFEQALRQLQTLVERLERSDLDLSTAIASFEQGVSLSRQCGQLLQAAEQRVEVLSRSSGGEAVLTPMPQDDEDDGE